MQREEDERYRGILKFPKRNLFHVQYHLSPSNGPRKETWMRDVPRVFKSLFGGKLVWKAKVY